MVTQEDLFCEN